MTILSVDMETAPPQDIQLSLGQKEVLVTIRLVMAFLSMFGCFFVLVCMVKWKRLYGPHRLILILTLCNLGDAVSSLLSFGTFSHESDRSGLCYFQGFMMQFFQVAAFCWSAMIAVNLWFVIVRRRLDVDSFQPVYHIVVWSITAVCVILPNFTKAYGPASVWCWISKTARLGNAFRFITFFVPFYISWFVIIICYIWIARVSAEVYSVMRDEEKDKTKRQLSRLRWYPIIFVVLYIPATLNRVYNWASQDDIFFLYLLQVLTAPAVGFVNSIAYGLDTESRHRIGNFFVRRGMCSYCFGDVLLDENVTSHDRSASAGHEQMDEAEIVDGVLDDYGGIRRHDNATIPLESDYSQPAPPLSPYSARAMRREEEEDGDTIKVDF